MPSTDWWGTSFQKNMRSHFLTLAWIASIALAQQNNSTDTESGDSDSGDSKPSASAGDFIFDKPAEKAKTPEAMKAGDTYTIKWHVEPKDFASPSNITIEYRRGRWPNVGEWMVIDKEIGNEGEYEWEVPENSAPEYYVFRISTPPATPLVRTRVSQPFQIYQKRDAQNIIDSSAPSTAASGFLGIFVTALGYFIA